MSDTPAEQVNNINRAFADTIAAKDAEIRRLESKLAALETRVGEMEEAVRVLGNYVRCFREGVRNRSFIEYTDDLSILRGCVDANPIASAAIAGAGEGGKK